MQRLNTILRENMVRVKGLDDSLEIPLFNTDHSIPLKEYLSTPIGIALLAVLRYDLAVSFTQAMDLVTKYPIDDFNLAGICKVMTQTSKDALGEHIPPYTTTKTFNSDKPYVGMLTVAGSYAPDKTWEHYTEEGEVCESTISTSNENDYNTIGIYLDGFGWMVFDSLLSSVPMKDVKSYILFSNEEA